MEELQNGDGQDSNSWEGVLSPSPDVSMINVLPADAEEKSSSPVSEFIADEEAASTCPLLTPSPPAEFGNLLTSDMAYEQQVSPTSTDKLVLVTPSQTTDDSCNSDILLAVTHNKNIDSIRSFNPTSSIQSVVESSSSGSSVLHEPTASAQLLGSHHYQQLTKGNNVLQYNCPENGGKPPMAGIQLATLNRSPEDFPFMKWNWSIIRKLSFWTVISILMGCLCFVIATLANLSTNCDPPRGWWQGTLFYEIFPASFKDSDFDGMGDFKGLISQVDYLKRLGVQVVHLDSFLNSTDYPQNYHQIYNYSCVHPDLGSDQDFDRLIKAIHTRDMYLVVNMHITPHSVRKEYKEIERLQKIEEKKSDRKKKKIVNKFSALSAKVLNETELEEDIESELESNGIPLTPMQFEGEHLRETISDALEHWLSRGIDGFYMVGIENFLTLPNFSSIIRKWRKVLNKYSNHENRKILIFNGNILYSKWEFERSEVGRAMLNAADLIDVHISMEWNNTEFVKKQITDVLEGFIYEHPGYPWVHWNMGDINNERLSSQISIENGTVVALMILMMLPGTSSIFYGDEIGVRKLETFDLEENRNIIMENVPPMKWYTSEVTAGFTASDIEPWQKMPKSQTYAAEEQTPLVQTIKLKQSSLTLAMNGIWKENLIAPNCNIKAYDRETLIIERTYPRHPTYILIANLGARIRHHNLSKMYYGGEVIADFNGKTGQFLKFRSVTLFPGQAILVKLDK